MLKTIKIPFIIYIRPVCILPSSFAVLFFPPSTSFTLLGLVGRSVKLLYLFVVGYEMNFWFIGFFAHFFSLSLSCTRPDFLLSSVVVVVVVFAGCWLKEVQRGREWRLAPFVVLHFDSVVVAGLLLIRGNIIIEEPIFCDADNDKRRQRGWESDSQATIQPTDRSDTLIDACSNNSTWDGITGGGGDGEGEKGEFREELSSSSSFCSCNIHNLHMEYALSEEWLMSQGLGMNVMAVVRQQKWWWWWWWLRWTEERIYIDESVSCRSFRSGLFSVLL